MGGNGGGGCDDYFVFFLAKHLRAFLCPSDLFFSKHSPAVLA